MKWHEKKYRTCKSLIVMTAWRRLLYGETSHMPRPFFHTVFNSWRFRGPLLWSLSFSALVLSIELYVLFPKPTESFLECFHCLLVDGSRFLAKMSPVFPFILCFCSSPQVSQLHCSWTILLIIIFTPLSEIVRGAPGHGQFMMKLSSFTYGLWPQQCSLENSVA